MDLVVQSWKNLCYLLDKYQLWNVSYGPSLTSS